MAQDEKAEVPSVEILPPRSGPKLRELLKPFFDANPGTTLEEVTLRDEKQLILLKPWNDESLVLVVPENFEPFVAALNNLILPSQFTAMWHRDIKELEIIWTAYAITGPAKETLGRNFIFVHAGNEFRCAFDKSSARLLEVADSSRPIAATNTGYRNLVSYQDYARLKKTAITEMPARFGEPLSFWVRGLEEFNVDSVLSLASHLNFYMTYYDATSPTVLIHSHVPSTSQPRTRYVWENKFPDRIEGRLLDDILTQMWSAARTGDSARRFLYYFRIIEHASSSYLEASLRREVQKILGAPHARSDLRDVIEQVALALQKAKLDEYQKFEAIIRDAVSPKLLLREIKRNPSAFTSATTFDGDCVIEALCSEAQLGKEEDYQVRAIGNFTKAIRDIRNALAHGREQRTAGVISPTTANFNRLDPWVSLISVAAGEVILYKDII